MTTPLHSTPLHALHLPIQNILLAVNPFHCFFAKSLWAGKKLRTSFAIIKRISSYIPTANYKSIYHTLFESYLSYCISTWGRARKKLVDQVFIRQKVAIRYLFGNYEKFLDTSARTRPYGEQQLGVSFYRKEHTKPLFTKHNILTVHNLYVYMAFNEVSKLITLRSPSILRKLISHHVIKRIVYL